MPHSLSTNGFVLYAAMGDLLHSCILNGGEAIPGASLQNLEAKRLRMTRAALALCAMHARTAFTPGACRARMPHDATRLATPNAVAATHASKAGLCC